MCCWWFIYFIHTKIKIKKSIDRLLSWRHWNSKNKKMITMCVTDRIFVCVCVWTTFLFFSISFWLMIDWFLSLFSFTLDYLFCFFFCPLPTTHRHTQWNYRLNELRDFSFCCFNVRRSVIIFFCFVCSLLCKDFLVFPGYIRYTIYESIE